MKMHVAAKIILGLLTAWVILVPALLAGLWFAFSLSVAFSESITPSNGTPYISFFFLMLFIYACTAFLSIGMKGFYLVHDIVNRNGSNILRALLGLGIVFLPVIGMPFYYFTYIVPDNPPAWALIPPQQAVISTPTMAE